MEECDITKCFLCSESLTDPRLLPDCLHSFCLQCLENYVKETMKTNNTSVNCPKCKIEFIIPVEGLKSLKKNEFVDHLNKMSLVKLCEICSKGDIEKFCVECNQSYCSKCSAHHLNIPSLKSHTIKNAESYVKSDVNTDNNEYTICDFHHKKMKVYCNDCNIHACSICFEESHSKHVMTSLKSQFEVMRNKLDDVLKFNEQKCQEINQKLKEINELSSKYYESGNEIKRQIKEKSDALKLLIDSYSNSLMEEVDEEVESCVKRANDVIDELNKMRLSNKLLIEECKKKIENLNYKTVLGTSIEDQSDISPFPSFPDEFHLIFHPSNSEQINSNMIGNLTSVTYKSEELEKEEKQKDELPLIKSEKLEESNLEIQTIRIFRLQIKRSSRYIAVDKGNVYVALEPGRTLEIQVFKQFFKAEKTISTRGGLISITGLKELRGMEVVDGFLFLLFYISSDIIGRQTNNLYIIDLQKIAKNHWSGKYEINLYSNELQLEPLTFPDIYIKAFKKAGSKVLLFQSDLISLITKDKKISKTIPVKPNSIANVAYINDGLYVICLDICGAKAYNDLCLINGKLEVLVAFNIEQFGCSLISVDIENKNILVYSKKLDEVAVFDCNLKLTKSISIRKELNNLKTALPSSCIFSKMSVYSSKIYLFYGHNDDKKYFLYSLEVPA